MSSSPGGSPALLWLEEELTRHVAEETEKQWQEEQAAAANSSLLQTDQIANETEQLQGGSQTEHTEQVRSANQFAIIQTELLNYEGTERVRLEGQSERSATLKAEMSKLEAEARKLLTNTETQALEREALQQAAQAAEILRLEEEEEARHLRAAIFEALGGAHNT